MKILYVTTISNTVNAFLIPHIKMLIDEGHQVDVAFNIEQEIKPEIYEMGCKIHQLPFQRSPLKKDNLIAYKKLKHIIDDYIDGKLPSIKIVLLQDFSNELGNILKSYEPEKRDILNIDKKESV